MTGQQNLIYDYVCVTELEGRLLHCRCFAASEEAVVSVILANDVGREEMLAACIPLAVHPKATRALLINVRSGDMHIMKLHCKEAFLREVLRMRGGDGGGGKAGDGEGGGEGGGREGGGGGVEGVGDEGGGGDGSGGEEGDGDGGGGEGGGG